MHRNWVSSRLVLLISVFALAACGGPEVSENKFEQVQVGMTPAQVEALLGVPAGEQSLGSYTFLDWKTPELVIRVTFRNGVVEKKIARDPRVPVEEPPTAEPVLPQTRVLPGGPNFSNPEMRD